MIYIYETPLTHLRHSQLLIQTNFDIEHKEQGRTEDEDKNQHLRGKHERMDSTHTKVRLFSFSFVFNCILCTALSMSYVIS